MNANEADNPARRWEGQDEQADRQRQVAAEIAADERLVGPALDVPVPAGVLMRVHARMAEALTGERARQQRRLRRWVGGLSVAAAAAAAIIVAVVLLEPSHRPGAVQRPSGGAIAPADDVRDFLKTPGDDFHDRAQMLSDEIADYQVQLALADDWHTDMSISGLEHELSEFLLEEPDDPALYVD